MNKYPLVIYCDHPEVHFEHRTAARLARVSEAFIHQCEHEGLITSCVMLHGKKGLLFADVCKLKRIRHLHEDMGLDLEAVDLVLRHLDQIKTLQRRLAEMEQQLHQKEQEYLAEIQALKRRLAQLTDGD